MNSSNAVLAKKNNDTTIMQSLLHIVFKVKSRLIAFLFWAIYSRSKHDLNTMNLCLLTALSYDGDIETLTLVTNAASLQNSLLDAITAKYGDQLKGFPATLEVAFDLHKHCREQAKIDWLAKHAHEYVHLNAMFAEFDTLCKFGVEEVYPLVMKSVLYK